MNMKSLFCALFACKALAPNVSGFSLLAVGLPTGKTRRLKSPTLLWSTPSDDAHTDMMSSASDVNGAGSSAVEDEQKRSFSTIRNTDDDEYSNIVDRDPLPQHESIQKPAGLLCDDHEVCITDETTNVLPHRGRYRKRVLILCTGGTLTMSNDPTKGNSLAPVQGALTEYLASMRELTDDPEMPEIVSHEYAPLIDSSDMGPGDWALIAQDIATNYYHFDGTTETHKMENFLSKSKLAHRIILYEQVLLCSWEQIQWHMRHRP